MQVREVTHLVAVADELLGNVDELLELLRHGSGQYEREGTFVERGKDAAGSLASPVDV